MNELPELEQPRKRKNDESGTPPFASSGVYGSRRRTIGPAGTACLVIIGLFIVLCCVLPLIFIIGTSAFFGVTRSNNVDITLSEQMIIPAEGEVNLEVSNPVGETRIQGRNNITEVEVVVSIKAYGISQNSARSAAEAVEVTVERDGDRYIVNVENDGGQTFWQFNNSPEVKLTITVPRDLNINAVNNVGTLRVENVNIIDALNLEVNTGEVNFEGRVGPVGQHSITTNVGSVNMRLDRSSNFDLEATTNIGSVNVRSGVLSNQTSRAQGIGNNVTGVYGAEPNPEARLIVRTDIGEVNIRD